MRIDPGMVNLDSGLLIASERLATATFREVKVGIVSWEYVL